MSGLFSSIGKIFKKVIPFLKKIALPALAIAAVVVTGGAALGLLPGIAGLGGLALSLGAPAGVAAILSTAATGATVGMIGGLITGGSIGSAVKGASMGFLAGGVAGGIGLAAGGLGGATGVAPGAASAAGGTGASSAADLAGIYGDVPGAAELMGSAGGLGQGAAGIADIAGGAGGIGQAAGSVASSGGGGILGFLSKNPLIASGLMKGIGGALQSKTQLDELRRRRNSYNVTGVYQPYGVGSIDGLPDAGTNYNNVIYGQGQYDYDPVSGRVLPARQGG